MWLHQQEGSTDYLQNLIDRDRLDRLDHKVIDGKIREHQEAIKDLQGLKKTKSVDQDKLQECIRYWHDVYKDKTFKDKSELVKIIENRVLPKVRSLGYDKSAEDLADVFLEWPEKG